MFAVGFCSRLKLALLGVEFVPWQLTVGQPAIVGAKST